MPAKSQFVRITVMFAVAIVILVIPAAAVAVIGWNSAVLVAILAAMGGLFAVIGDRWRGLIWATLATGIGTVAAVFVTANPVASAGLMMCVGLALGIANKWGLALWNFMFPVVVATVISQTPKVFDHTVGNALINGGIVVGCMLVAGLLTSLVVKKPAQTSVPSYRPLVTVMYAINLTLLLTVAGYLSALWHEELPGMWMTLTVVVIIRPFIGDSVMRSLERAGGTILGFLIAIGVAYSLTPTPIYYGLGLVFLEIAVLVRFHPDRPYWEYVMFLTPGVVLWTGLPSQVTHYANYRLSATVVTAVACLLLLGIERLIFWRGGLTKAGATNR